jgi:hypothetical protein
MQIHTVCVCVCVCVRVCVCVTSVTNILSCHSTEIKKRAVIRQSEISFIPRPCHGRLVCTQLREWPGTTQWIIARTMKQLKTGMLFKDTHKLLVSSVRF